MSIALSSFVIAFLVALFYVIMKSNQRIEQIKIRREWNKHLDNLSRINGIDYTEAKYREDEI